MCSGGTWNTCGFQGINFRCILSFHLVGSNQVIRLGTKCFYLFFWSILLSLLFGGQGLLRQGFSMYPSLSWNSLVLNSQRSDCFCLPSAMMKGTCHHAPYCHYYFWVVVLYTHWALWKWKCSFLVHPFGDFLLSASSVLSCGDFHSSYFIWISFLNCVLSPVIPLNICPAFEVLHRLPLTLLAMLCLCHVYISVSYFSFFFPCVFVINSTANRIN